MEVVGSGLATVTVKDSYSGLTDWVKFNVTINAQSVTLSSNASASNFLDEQVTVTATVLPSGVTNDEITWTISNEEKLNVTKNGNKLMLTAKEAGVYTVSATCDGVTSESVSIKYKERPGEFVDDVIYVVGNSDFHTGVSDHSSGEYSWGDSHFAYTDFNELGKGPSDPADLSKQYEGFVRFIAGDEFKIRNPNWLGTYNAETTEKHFEDGGAIGEGKITVDMTANDANFVVVKTGYYRLIYKIFRQGTETESIQLYLEDASLSASTSIVQPAVGESESFEIHNWHGNVTAISGDTNIATVGHEDESVTVTVTGVNQGNTTINITDGYDVVEVEVYVIAKKAIYLNANGIFNEANAVIFAHA